MRWNIKEITHCLPTPHVLQD